MEYEEEIEPLRRRRPDGEEGREKESPEGAGKDDGRGEEEDSVDGGKGPLVHLIETEGEEGMNDDNLWVSQVLGDPNGDSWEISVVRKDREHGRGRRSWGWFGDDKLLISHNGGPCHWPLAPGLGVQMVRIAKEYAARLNAEEAEIKRDGQTITTSEIPTDQAEQFARTINSTRLRVQRAAPADAAETETPHPEG